MADKLSTIVLRMAMSLMKDPQGTPSPAATYVGLLLAHVAWNREVEGDAALPASEYQPSLQKFQSEDPTVVTSLKSTNWELLIGELRLYKKANYPDDKRIIGEIAINERGNVQVTWH